MTAQSDAKTLIEEQAADPSMDPLMERCPDDATDAELRASIRIKREERTNWRARD